MTSHQLPPRPPTPRHLAFDEVSLDRQSFCGKLHTWGADRGASCSELHAAAQLAVWVPRCAACLPTPIVGLELAWNSPRQNLLKQLVFPTPESPISTTCAGRQELAGVR